MAKKKPTRPKSRPKASKPTAKRGRVRPPARDAAGRRDIAKRARVKGARSKPPAGEPEALFAQACDLASRGFLFDAIALFRQVTLHRAHDLADDAWTDIGLCSLRMRLFADALEAFGRVIDDYPDATIARVAGQGKEFGRTAAKARLGRVHALLGLGDVESARRETGELELFADSYITTPDGARKTFHSLAIEALG